MTVSARTRLIVAAVLGLVSTVFLTAGSLAASMGGLSTMVPGDWAKRLISWLMGWAPVRLILGAAATTLTFAWILAKPKPGARRWPSVVVFALWSLPLLLIPPVLSRDAVAYADLGWMLNHGHDPYTESMHQLGSPFPIDPKWGDTTTPYPPLSLWSFKWLGQIIGVHPYWNIVSMRIPVLIGIALLVWSLPRVARFIGADPGFAVWFGVLNPIMLIHGLGGAHNDVLMAGVTVAALALATLPGGLLWGSIAAGTAGCIKQVGLAAAVGVAGIALIRWRRRQPVTARRSESLWYRHGPVTLLTLASITLSAATFVGWTYVTGLGFGWTNSPGPLDSATATPALVMASATYWMINHGWFSVPFKVASTWLSIGRVVAAIIALIEYWRHAVRDPIRVVAVITLVWALGYGVLWEWYLIAPLALIGVASAGRRLLGFANWVMWYCLATSVVRLVIGSTHLLTVGWISALAASVFYLLVRPHRWALPLSEVTPADATTSESDAEVIGEPRSDLDAEDTP